MLTRIFLTGALQTISVEWPKKYGHFRRGWFGLNGYIDISCPIAAEVRTFHSDIMNPKLWQKYILNELYYFKK
jgi:hypothetical protein